MLYTITTIRISNETGQFQNTETNTFMLGKQVEDELRNNGCSFEEVEKFLNLQAGESTTCEATITNGVKSGTRFTYIHRIS